MRAWSETGDSLPHAHSLFDVHRRKTQLSETGDTATHPHAVIFGRLNQLDSSFNLFLAFFWAVQFCCAAAFAPTGPVNSADWEGNGIQVSCTVETWYSHCWNQRPLLDFQRNSRPSRCYRWQRHAIARTALLHRSAQRFRYHLLCMHSSIISHPI